MILKNLASSTFFLRLLFVGSGLSFCSAPLLEAKSGGADSGALEVRWENAGQKVFPEPAKLRGEWTEEGRLTLAGHEYEAVQLVLFAREPLKNVKVEFGPLEQIGGTGRISQKNIQLGLVKTVTIKDKQWPDPIVVFQPFELAAKSLQSVWVTVYVPKGTAPGDYKSEVKISADGLSRPVTSTLKVQVWNFTLPVTGTLDTLASWDLAPESREEVLRHRFGSGGPFFGAGEVAMPKGRINAAGEIDFDWTDYDRDMERYFALGLNRFGLPWSAGDGTGLLPIRMQFPFLDEATGQVVVLSLNPLESPETSERAKRWFTLFADHLREKGWLDKALVYLWDEPGPNHNAKILEMGQLIKEAAPDLTIMLTEWPVEELYPVVDVFCTHVTNLRDAHLPVMQRAQEQGKELWWYTCDDPYPSPTAAIPYDALTLRTMSWLTWKFGLTGTVYSLFNWSGDKDPYTFPGKNGLGGEMLVYPPENGEQVVSIRLEMMRDGIEDYEYLAILKREIEKATARKSPLVEEAKRLLQVPDAVAKNADVYTTDPKVLEKQRAKIAEMIEKLRAEER